MDSPVPAYILAGGRSSRFGSDKARAVVDGQPLIARIARVVAPLVCAVRVVADRPGKYADLGLDTIGDEVPGAGPMGGLHAALRHGAAKDWLLLISCDLVALQAAWVQLLLSHVSPQSKAIAFRHERWEPLLGLYHISLLPEVTRRIEQRELAMRDLLNAVGASAFPVPADWPEICQFNTPGDLERFLLGRGI